MEINKKQKKKVIDYSDVILKKEALNILMGIK